MKTENGRTYLNLERPIFDPMATVVVVEFEGIARSTLTRGPVPYVASAARERHVHRQEHGRP